MSAVKMLTMAEAAHELGPDFYEGHERNVEQWMRRRLRAKESELKMKILVRDGRRYLVARPVLRVAFHDRVDHQAIVSKELTRRLENIGKGVSKVDGRLDNIEANIATLAEFCRELRVAQRARKA
jgi:hypothetical protein